MINPNQPVRGTSRPHLSGKSTNPQVGSRKRANTVDMVAARVTALFAPYMTDIGDTDFMELSGRLAAILSSAMASPFARRREP